MDPPLRQHGGGATTRGEGEAQIETDRRLLRRRIQQLREELEVVRKQRTTQRKARERNAVPHGAIVGYTNVGKSSLLRALPAPMCWSGISFSPPSTRPPGGSRLTTIWNFC